jgi:hypothetical protein
VSFEGSNRTFSSIAAVDIGWDELVVALPLLFDDAFVVCAGFVIENLEIDSVAAVAETLHDGVVRFNTVCIFFGLEGGCEDHVGIAVVCDHDVLVSFAGTNREAAGVVRVQFAD